MPSPQHGQFMVYDFNEKRWESRTMSVGTGLSKVDNGSDSIAFTLVPFVGDSGTGGFIGGVPAPAAGDGAEFKYLSADGLWRTLAVSSHNSLTDLAGGINEGVFESSAFEITAFQQGVVQFYHLTAPDYNSIVNQQSILSTAIDTDLDDEAYNIVVTASAKTITLPNAQASRFGRTWTVIQNCAGYVDVAPEAGDEIILPGGSDTIRLDQIGSNVSLRCVSATQWVIV
jgi:hypothetical protein